MSIKARLDIAFLYVVNNSKLNLEEQSQVNELLGLFHKVQDIESRSQRIMLHDQLDNSVNICSIAVQKLFYKLATIEKARKISQFVTIG